MSEKWKAVPESLRNELKKACQSARYPIVLSGNPGVGKTFAMRALQERSRGRSAWWSVTELTRTIQIARREGGVIMPGATYETSETNLWRVHISEPDSLFLDDLGVRAPTDSAYEILYDVLERRGTMPLIVSTNLPAKELLKVYESRICSRLLQGTFISVTGRDRRFQDCVQTEVEV